MTKEDKALLLKDLSSRLPYGIKAEVKYYDGVWELLAVYTNGTTHATRDIGYPIETYYEDCKPYLYPLSSMTKAQKKEYAHLLTYTSNVDMIQITGESTYDWLNKNMFDWRGLIPKGLANDATGLNIY